MDDLVERQVAAARDVAGAQTRPRLRRGSLEAGAAARLQHLVGLVGEIGQHLRAVAHEPGVPAWREVALPGPPLPLLHRPPLVQPPRQAPLAPGAPLLPPAAAPGRAALRGK